MNVNDFSVPILTYHSIDDSGSVVSTSRRTFRRQMLSLSESRMSVVSLGEIAAAIREGRALPRDAVTITFDDGYRNVYTEAFPVLERCGFTATVFLVTDYCGLENDWPGQGGGIARAPLLTWAEVREMHRAGIEFGSHTATHPDLTRIPLQQAEREIRRSKAEIEDHLGVEATAFAYPYGKYNARVKDLVREEFLCAGSTLLGRAGSDSDPYSLKRVEMYYFSNAMSFGALIAGRADWYLAARQALRKLKAILQ
jgi:peptidoglycan/xylan/chitin deacetylase (PgdA/CDA1 family)